VTTIEENGAMTNTTRRDDFLAFSRVLTGFGMDVLVDADDAADYLRIFDAHARAINVDAILYIYRRITTEMMMTPRQTVEAILAGTFDDRWPAWPLSTGTKSLLKLWYTGTWVSPSTDSDPVIPSPQAYARGLVWLAAQAHPVGVSKLRFGHWENAPPPLSEFVGDTA
jgi:hypothetical protein